MTMSLTAAERARRDELIELLALWDIADQRVRAVLASGGGPVLLSRAEAAALAVRSGELAARIDEAAALCARDGLDMAAELQRRRNALIAAAAGTPDTVH